MTLAVRVSGVDITDDVIIRDAKFVMANGPNPGEFELRVKDPSKTFSFRAGNPIEADFEGVRCFEGIVFQAVQSYAFAVDDTSGAKNVVRIWTLRGTDLNILFRKRFVFNQSNPASALGLEFAAGTSDLTYLSAIIARLTLDDDDLTTDFHHVGSPNPDRRGIAASLGDPWERVMALTAKLPGAIWGIRPPRTVYYEDDDTETAPFAISDDPDQSTSFGYSNLDWLEDGTGLVNDAQIWGVGLGKDRVTYDRVQDATSIAEHGRWENGSGFRYDLYKQASVNAVASSLVYGSPQNLHGGKDPALVVKCRVKKPGLMPGHKVRVISTVFGDEVVLPLRKFTMTFVTKTEALFDLELSWLIDEALDFFDYPPFRDEPGTDDTTTPNPCDDADSGLWWIDGGGWEMARSNPLLGGILSASETRGAMFLTRRRYFQRFGIVDKLLGIYGDGFYGTSLFAHFRKTMVRPAKWVLVVDFEVPIYEYVEGFHLPRFPSLEGGIWYGAQSNDLYASSFLRVSVFSNPYGDGYRLLTTSGGVNTVLGATGHQPQGKRFRFELNSSGQARCWAWAEAARPVSPNAGTTSGLTDGLNTFPYTGSGKWAGTDPDFGNRIYIQQQSSSGGVGPLAGAYGDASFGANVGVEDYIYAATGTPDVEDGLFWKSSLLPGPQATIPISSFAFVSLPASFSFSTDSLPDCLALDTQPFAGADNCESIEGDGTSYQTSFPFVAGSTKVSLEGVDMRLGLDYDEDFESHEIVFRSPVLSSARLYVCYVVMGP